MQNITQRNKFTRDRPRFIFTNFVCFSGLGNWTLQGQGTGEVRKTQPGDLPKEPDKATILLKLPML